MKFDRTKLDPRVKRHMIVSTLFTLALAFFIDHTYVNETDSLPKGWYYKTSSPIERGRIVTACLSEKDTNFGLQRHYFFNGSECYGAAPIMKQVVAIPGDDVFLTKDFIAVNGKKFNLKTFQYDSRHRKLPHFQRGEYYPTEGYWLIGTNNPKSWDSRYFGPIHKSQILWVVTPVLTW